MNFLKKILLLLGLFILLIISVFTLYYLNTNYGIGLICVSNKLTGLYCSGCGMTRAVFSLLKLDFYQAFRYNIFSLLLLPVLLLYFISYIYSWLFNKPNSFAKRIPQAFWIIMAILLLVFGVIRNIPIFSFLAPTIIQ